MTASTAGPRRTGGPFGSGHRVAAHTVPMRDTQVGLERSEFDELARQHRRELHLHCHRMLGSIHDAKDMVRPRLGWLDDRSALQRQGESLDSGGAEAPLSGRSSADQAGWKITTLMTIPAKASGSPRTHRAPVPIVHP